MLFYQSKRQLLSYNDIILHVAQCEEINKLFQPASYTDFILNVIVAIVHEEDIVLVDYRNKIDGIKALKAKDVVPIAFANVDALISAIKSSKSNVGIYSSGTTGTPKLINQTIDRLMKSVRISDEYHNSRWGFTYNPSHSAGIQVFLQVICNQATLFDLYKRNRDDIIATVNKEKIMYLSATPTFYRMLAPYNFIFTSLCSLTFNGEKSTGELINNLKAVCPNAKVRNIYGSTESGPLMSSETTVFTVPQRLINYIKIVEKELLISGDLISDSVGHSDWYQTGDLVRVVDDSPLTIEFVTRKTRILNVGGQNVNPQEVEEILISHSKIKDARVFGRQNKLIGNLVAAEIQKMNHSDIKEKEIIDWCKSNLAAYKVPRMIKFVDQVGVGRTGKKLV